MPKSATEISGLRSIRSMHTTVQRGIPKTKSSAYLNLYMLRKEIERLEKEKEIAGKRIQGVDKRLADIQKEVSELEKLTGTGQEKVRRVSEEPVTEDKKWKRMSLNY